MTTFATAAPFTFYTDIDGTALDGGYVYFGVANANPEISPISVYWDADLSIPAAQPIRTINGYPSRNGSVATVYTASAYSTTVRDKVGVLVFSKELVTAEFHESVTNITMTGSSVTLTPGQYGNPIITISGALTANLNMVFPDGVAGQWSVVNKTTGAFAITAKTASGTGFVLSAGANNLISDGVNAVTPSRADVRNFGASPSATSAVNTAAFAAAIAAGPGRVYIPNGIYNLDSLVLSGRSVVLSGESMGSPTLTHGVILRCANTCVDFITVSGVAHQIENIYIDGAAKASGAVVRYTGNITDIVTREVIIGGGQSGSKLLALSANPVNANAQISELKFYGLYLAGDTGVTNLYINSDQAVVNSFYSLKSFSGDGGIEIIRGTTSMYCPFFTANLSYDIALTGGQVTIFDGRSESSAAPESVSMRGSGSIALYNYVHGSTIAKTTLNIQPACTGTVTVVGGQYTNIANSSTSAKVSLTDPDLYAGGAVYGAGAQRIIWVEDGVLKNHRNAAFSATRSTTFTAINATWTKVPYSSERFDNNSNFDTALSRFTPTIAGLYQINFNAYVNPGAGQVQIALYKNNAAYVIPSVVANSSQGPTLNGTSLVSMNGTTDYLEVFIFQNAGGDLPAGCSEFSGYRVGA